MKQQMIALVDCVAFYANVERQFHASLQNRPVVVLSLNDGNIVSLSAEAKEIGLKRGMPYGESQPIFRQHQVAVFSSNFALYRDSATEAVVRRCAFVFLVGGVQLHGSKGE